MLAHGGGGGRKAPEIPKVMGRAPLWNFNPRQLMGGAGGTPSQAGGGTAGGGDRECRGVREEADQLEMGQPLLLA